MPDPVVRVRVLHARTSLEWLFSVFIDIIVDGIVLFHCVEAWAESDSKQASLRSSLSFLLLDGGGECVPAFPPSASRWKTGKNSSRKLPLPFKQSSLAQK